MSRRRWPKALRLAHWLWLACICGLCLRAGPALGFEYPIFVDIEDEEDLYQLFEEQQIEEDVLNTLVDLLRAGVDLNEATRRELYALPNLTLRDVDAILTLREEKGRFNDPSELVSGGALSERKLLALAPFLVVLSDAERTRPWQGWVRYQANTVFGEGTAPGMTLRSRVWNHKVQAGLVGVFRRYHLGLPYYDPDRGDDGALVAGALGHQFHLPKFYASYRQPNYWVILGTYRTGFGERLTFDTTGIFRPRGARHDDVIRRSTVPTLACKMSTGELDEGLCPNGVDADTGLIEYNSPDYAWTDGLRGIAGAYRLARGQSGSLWAHGFASWQRYSQYQTEYYETSRDPAETVPLLSDPTAPSAAHLYRSPRGLYDQLVLGSHLRYEAKRFELGVTGWGAQVDWRIEGGDFDFRNSARLPAGGGFGAVGLDAEFGYGWWDAAAELTRSFDKDDGGGFAALMRNTATFVDRELELLLRYYGADFANPYARSYSQPDEHNGLRVRDELGGRIRLTEQLDETLDLRSWVDFWINPSDDVRRMAAMLRADWTPIRPVGLALWGQWYNKNLDYGGREQCYDGQSTIEINGERLPCAGEQWRVGARARYTPARSWVLSAQYQHVFRDDRIYDDAFRQDLAAWAIVLYRPTRTFSFRNRVRYLFEDVSDPARLERSLRWTSEVRLRLLKERLWTRIRYDLIRWLDTRDRTALRTPNPVNWLWLELEGRF